MYLRVASALASIARKQGDVASAGRFLMRAVAIDPFDEDAQLGLVQALAEEGRRPDARRAYQTYVERMAELEVEPAPFPGGA